MNFLVIVNNTKDWPLELPPGGEIITARLYLTDPAFSSMRGVRVFNLCRTYRYQSIGYYVSLLAAARGHRVIPALETVHDLKSITLVRAQMEDDLEELVQSTLKRAKGDQFSLDVWFGHTMSSRHERLAQKLFAQFPVPFMKVDFRRDEDGWEIQRVRMQAATEIPEEHKPAVIEAANRFFTRKTGVAAPKRQPYRYELAILYDPKESENPSDPEAIEKFAEAARSRGLRPEIINKDDLPRLPSFDALFIRQFTAVNNITYRFAQRAEAEDMVVIDDPKSILRCTNKVYLKELLERHNLRTPRTLIAHSQNIQVLPATLGFPFILKEPDSGFSLGVFKVEDRASYATRMEELLEKSDLLVAQEFLPTDFDWRVTVLDGQPLFCCRYGMAKDHWQIVHHAADGTVTNGWSESVAIEAAPPHVIKTAVRAARLIGDGLYGVDLKETKGRCYVIEINDNPSIDADVEDRILGDELYERVMDVFLKRIIQRKNGLAAPS